MWKKGGRGDGRSLDLVIAKYGRAGEAGRGGGGLGRAIALPSTARQEKRGEEVGAWEGLKRNQVRHGRRCGERGWRLGKGYSVTK